jgi:uncharacterized DUF497 family protein
LGSLEGETKCSNTWKSFDRAATVFLDPDALSDFDEPHSEQEDRWVTMGLDNTGTLLVVCHTYQDTSESNAKIRMISARKATRAEAKQYRKVQHET